MSTPKLGHYPPADFPAPVRALAAISRGLAVLEGVGIGVCLISLVGLATFQFVSRNIRMRGGLWFPNSPDWIDGVIRHSVFLLGFIGAAYAAFTGRHIRIDAVTRMVKIRARMALRIITTLGALAICSAIVWGSVGFYKVTAEEAGEASSAGQLFTSSRGAMIIIVGLSLVGFHFFVQIIMDAVFLISGKEPPQNWISEAHAEGPPLSNQEVMVPEESGTGGDKLDKTEKEAADATREDKKEAKAEAKEEAEAEAGAKAEEEKKSGGDK